MNNDVFHGDDVSEGIYVTQIRSDKCRDRIVKVLRRCVLRPLRILAYEAERAKFPLIDPITRLFRPLIRFRKFIFGRAAGET